MSVRFLVQVAAITSFSSLAQAEIILPAVDCVIIPSKTVDISAAVPGLIGKLHAERSDSVKKGMLLGELNSRVEQANVELSRVRSEMSAEISAEQVNLKYDQLQSRRVRDLKQKNLISAQNKDEAARLEKVTYWRLKQAQDAFRTRQLELDRAVAQLEEKKVYSTLDGVVAQVYKAEGEYVEDQPIMRLVQLNPLHVEAVLPMEHYGQVQKNMQGSVYAEIAPNTKLSAKVMIIDPVGDTASGTFGVRLSMQNPDNKIPAGMKCVLRLEPSTIDQSVEIQKNTTDMLAADAAPGATSTPLPEAVKALTSAESPLDEIITTENSPEMAAVQTDAAVVQQRSLPVVLPDPEESLQKHSFGPFNKESTLLSVGKILTSQGYTYSRRDEGSSVIKGYLVLLAEDYAQSKRQLMAEFRQRGVSGMEVLPRRSYNGRLSFGAYDGPELANVRHENLTQKGIRSEVVARRTGKVQLWLDVEQIAESKVASIIDQTKTVYN